MVEVHCIMEARQMGKSERVRMVEKSWERAMDIARLQACACFWEKRIHHGIGWLVFPFTNMECVFRAQGYREQLAALKRKPL